MTNPRLPQQLTLFDAEPGRTAWSKEEGDARLAQIRAHCRQLQLDRMRQTAAKADEVGFRDRRWGDESR